MKQDLLNCIGQISHIEALFTQDNPIKGLAIPNMPYIYNNEEFAIWKSELSIDLQDIVDRTGAFL